MKIGIVGSREFPQLNLVDTFISDLPDNITIVSGGARGVDAMARECAEKYGLSYIEYLPDLSNCQEKREYTEAYYKRNQQIVDHSDLIVAFTEKTSGGTWDTIKRARQKGIPCKIIKPFLLFPGQEEIEKPEEKVEVADTKGKGPFHLRRITLGSFALNLKRYADENFLADFVNWKDNDPKRFSEEFSGKYLEFFEKFNPGVVHAITPAPRSIRHLDRDHCMLHVCETVAKKLNCDFVELFQPWQKVKRCREVTGRPDIAISDNVQKYIGKVVYILDDVVTTGITLQSACKALTALQIHCHGLAYMFWS
jgi:phosphoribosylpyrophosphate synthetase